MGNEIGRGANSIKASDDFVLKRKFTSCFNMLLLF
jgi:hypothetical protein